MGWYAAAIGSIIVLGAWCILRVRAEYVREAMLSRLTVAAVWMLYVAHFAITLSAAATSRWPVPVNKEDFLERTFGEAHRDYRASTHRYLGLPR